jgi:hypothetical protein
MPDLSRFPLEDEDKLTPTDEQARKKQVLKDRKKVRTLPLHTDLYVMAFFPNI